MANNIDPELFKEAITRLAHFNPSCKDEYGNQVIDYLVLDTLSTFGILKATQKEIISTIKSRFLLDFEESEIISSGTRLLKKELIILEHDSNNNHYFFQILPECDTKINSNLCAIKQLESEVIEEWHKEIKKTYKEYDIIIRNIDKITDTLHVFISKIFKIHGIESVALLYPDNNKTNTWQESFSNSILTEIQSVDEFTDTIIKIEIPKFFRSPDEKRKTYILSLLNSSFFWHLVQVDEDCSRLFRNITTGQKLFIDNNILQCLVGIDGPSLLTSSHRLMELALDLGYELWITTKTIDEFHASLNWQMSEVKKKPLVTSTLARIALENLDENSFITTYWRELVEKGISIEDFILEKNHIDHILSGLNINVSDEFRFEIENSSELKHEVDIIRSITPDWINENILEHDAYHRIFINKLRGGNKYHFSEAVAWFLTNDSKLPKYDKLARNNNSSMAFCITSDQWIQVNRPFLSRTANSLEYEQSLYHIITQPFLRSLLPNFSIEKGYLNVMSALSRYKNMDSQLALKLVTDKHFMISIASEVDEGKIEEQIDSKFIDIAQEYKTKAETEEEKNIQLTQNIGQKSIELNSKETEIACIKEEKEMVEKKYENNNTKLIGAEEKIKNLQGNKHLLLWIIYIFTISLVTLILWMKPWFYTESLKTYCVGKLLINISIAIYLLFITIRTSKAIIIAVATLASAFLIGGLQLLVQ